MDGGGRALDNIFVERLWRNVKCEDVHLKGYANITELTVGLAKYFAFYNVERAHHALGYKTPDEVYRSSVGGGGALIIDKYGDVAAQTKQPCRGPATGGYPSTAARRK
jgi:putative transposase